MVILTALPLPQTWARKIGVPSSHVLRHLHIESGSGNRMQIIRNSITSTTGCPHCAWTESLRAEKLAALAAANRILKHVRAHYHVVLLDGGTFLYFHGGTKK